jgi:hypothetical protein
MPAALPTEVRTLREIGWELRRREPTVEIGSPSNAYRPARPASPERRTAAKERTDLPKWARVVPVLMLPGAAKRSGTAASDTRAMLSVSMDVGAP